MSVTIQEKGLYERFWTKSNQDILVLGNRMSYEIKRKDQQEYLTQLSHLQPLEKANTTQRGEYLLVKTSDTNVIQLELRQGNDQYASFNLNTELLAL